MPPAQAQKQLTDLRLLLEHLIDYAGVFPPAELPLEDAITEYRAALGSPYAWMLNRFICPLTRLKDLDKALPDSETWDVCTIADNATLANADALREALHSLEDVQATSRSIKLRTIEIRLTSPHERDDPDTRETSERLALYASEIQNTSLPNHVASFIEIPLGNHVDGNLMEIGHAGFFAKVRCGGIGLQATPDPELLASFVASCVRHQLPWKATAGLHHPIRHRVADPSLTGHDFYEHGFLNLLTATSVALAGGERSDVSAAIADTDPDHFVLQSGGLTWSQLRVPVTSAVRKLFIGYGSCSFSEPIADLKALNLV